jgi:hypothetical protein
MTLDVLADWLRTHPYPLAVAAVLAAVLAYALHRVRRAVGHVPGAVVMAAFGAVVSTAYSADTSWNFARDHLGMTSDGERAVMFAAAEIGLFSMALMARQNLRTQGAPGTPGVLVWVITGVQVIPAFSESGVVGGTVRAFVGPVLAALLWHLAMGIELRHSKPGADSQSLPAVLARELRERLLSWLGLAVRGRDAEQITRDRWTRVATRRAARLADLEASGARSRRVQRGRRRLAAAVDRTDAGVLPAQRAVLLDRIAAYRHASGLASVDLPSPWSPISVDVIHTDPAVEVERLPSPEALPEYMYPELPEAVPADHFTDVHKAIEEPERVLVYPAATAPRPRLEVRAEYVPETPEYTHPDGVPVPSTPDEEPEDDSPPPPAEDTLTPRARADFLHDLVDGSAPSIRALKDRYSIGQTRATRIKAELENGLTS